MSYMLAGLVLSIVIVSYCGNVRSRYPGCFFYCLTQLDNPSWAWLTIVLVCIAGNFLNVRCINTLAHNYVMNRR